MYVLRPFPWHFFLLLKEKSFKIRLSIHKEPFAKHLKNLEGMRNLEIASAAISGQPFEDHKHVLVFPT